MEWHALCEMVAKLGKFQFVFIRLREALRHRDLFQYKEYKKTHQRHLSEHLIM